MPLDIEGEFILSHRLTVFLIEKDTKSLSKLEVDGFMSCKRDLRNSCHLITPFTLKTSGFSTPFESCDFNSMV